MKTHVLAMTTAQFNKTWKNAEKYMLNSGIIHGLTAGGVKVKRFIPAPEALITSDGPKAQSSTARQHISYQRYVAGENLMQTIPVRLDFVVSKHLYARSFNVANKLCYQATRCKLLNGATVNRVELCCRLIAPIIVLRSR